MKEITIRFTVDADDLAEAVRSLLDSPSKGEQADLVYLIQYALYDDNDGPQLEGVFDVI